MRRVHALLIVFFFFSIFASPAIAQDDQAESASEPPKLQVVIIDSDPRDKGKAYKPVSKALEARDDVKVTSEGDFLESAKSRDVTLETLRKGSEREKAEEKIAGAMADAGIEVVIVIDAIKKRRYAQAVVLGPKGRELADIRERIGRLDSDKNVDKYILDEAFEVASVEVEEHRKMLAERAEEKRLADEKAARESQEGRAAEQGAGQQNEVAAGTELQGSISAKGPAFELDAGLLVGQRVFGASASESSYDVDSTTPLAGGEMRLGLRLVEFGSGELRFDASGAYAPLSMEFTADGGDPFKVSGHHVTGRAQVGFRYWFGSAYGGIALGADAVSSTLDPNSYFTGSRYISGLGGLEVGLLTAGGFGLSLGGGVLPVLDNNVSGDAYGEPTTMDIAYFGDAALRYSVTQSVALKVGYGIRRYSSQYDEPPLASSSVTATDLIHGGTLSVAFGL